MIFWNLHFTSLITFIIIFILWLFLFWLIYKNQNKKSLILLFISFLFLIINIFEIKWWYNNKIENVDWWKIVFALDVSKSMLSEDIKNKSNLISRFEASKWLIDNFIQKYTNNLYWLIVFAWESLEVLPFTNDSWVFKTVLYWVNNWNVSKNWTNLNSVFSSLETYFSWEMNWWLAVIFTDWWDEDISISTDLINSLKNDWIKILLVWVWTTSWTKIPDWSDFFWRKVYKQFLWKDVISKLNSKVLSNISTKNNIDYISINNISDFDEVND